MSVLQMSRRGQDRQSRQSNKTQMRFQKEQRRQQEAPPKKTSARAARRQPPPRGAASPSAPQTWGLMHYLVFYLALSAMLAPVSGSPVARRDRARLPAEPGPGGPLGTAVGSASSGLSLGNCTATDGAVEFRRAEMGRLDSRMEQLRAELPSCPTIRDMDSVREQIKQLYAETPVHYRNRALCNPNPSKGRVVAMVGLPGSGKSTKQNECTALGYHEYDDIGRYWPDLHEVGERARRGENVVMSDIVLTNDRTRAQKEKELGLPIDYIYFANNPEQCKKNAVYRQATTHPERDVAGERRNIDSMSRDYHPPENAHPVGVAPELPTASGGPGGGR
ncbi:hypothetical protein ACFOLJ_23935 [Rugamonas sp. CCM 8940]|uniref:hypothetical protein n=1 Tax=Rugamonas sp. CCM 8940 TaxID=2765359 RepID=UPI0018F30DEA|nr:hypothetical protein [Rugamonas sp. CCM 8940]MBJ7313506.1 hypothetical protein [Rugamonas sp. CCM 8940]